MPLKQIQKDLHNKESIYATRKHDETPYNEWRATDEMRHKHKIWYRLRNSIADTQMRSATIGLAIIGAFVLVAISIIVIVWFQRGFFRQEGVSLQAEMPVQVESNRTVEVAFTLANDNRATLRDAVIDISFGQYFVPAENQDHFTRTGKGTGKITVGDIDGKSESTITIIGNFVAPQDETESIIATLKYIPERTSTSYTRNVQVSTVVTSSPLAVDITTEKEAVSGNIVDIIFAYHNGSVADISDVQLEVTYPDGFVLQDSNAPVRAGTDNVWPIELIPARESGEVRVRGVISGMINEVVQFSAKIIQRGKEDVIYGETAYPVRIIASPVQITQKIVSAKGSSVAFAGDVIEYQVSARNNGTIPLRDVVLTTRVEGDVVDVAQLNLREKGSYDHDSRTITWKASDVPGLATMAPQDEVAVEFAVPIKGVLPITEQKNNHFTVTTVAGLNSFDLPTHIQENKNIATNAMVVRIGAKPLLQLQLTHVDGALPPKIGALTTYQIAVRAGVVNNDLRDARITGALPTGVTFSGQQEQDTEELVLNPRTNIFTWDIGNVAHGTGVTSDYHQVTFNIDVTPGVNQEKETLSLLKDIVFESYDTFTEQDVFARDKEVRSSDIISELNDMDRVVAADAIETEE